MKALRFHRILFVAAGLLFFAGFAFLGAGLDFGTDLRGEETFQLPAGGEWYYVVELPMQKGGRIHVVFEETAARAIDVHLFPQQDYEAYQAAGAVPSGRGTTSGPEGVFAMNIRSEGTYFLVFAHARENVGLPQEVEIRYSFTGVQPRQPDWVLVGAGLASVALGAVAVTLAALRRLRFLRAGVSSATARTPGG